MSAESIMFEKLAEAIKTADIPQIKLLFNQARTELNSDALLSQVDANGDTLLHLLFKSKRPNVGPAALQSYEVGFWQCLEVKNHAGDKPLDIIEKIPEINPSVTMVKQNIKKMFTPTFSQSWILKQFRQYLKFQHEMHPESYKLEDITKIINTLQQGHCSGLSALWAQGCLEEGKPDQEYVDSLKEVVYWDVKKESLTPEVIQKFERAISLARNNQYISLGPENFLSYYSPFENLNLLVEKQRDWDVLWGDDKYQKEVSLELKSITQDTLKQFIASFSVNKNEGKVANVTANNHSISFFYKDNTFHVTCTP